MYGRFAVGITLALGLVALASTEASAQRRPRVVVYGYSAGLPPTMPPQVKYYDPPPPRVNYYAPLSVTIYAPPSAAYYAAGPVFTESSTTPRDLPRNSPGYQGSWRNSRF
jgi:hypothetical protein